MKKYKSDKPCIVCGESKDNCVTYHHLYTRKAHPEYSEETWNLMPLCFIHHAEIHSIGTNKFAQKYKTANDWLKNNGWGFRLSGKVFHE